MDLKSIKRSIASHSMFALELTEGKLLKVYPREGEHEVDVEVVKSALQKHGVLDSVQLVRSPAGKDNTILICVIDEGGK